MTRRLQQGLWTVRPRKLVSYRAKGQGCVALSIHVPDTRKGVCLTIRGFKPIYLVCFNDCQCESILVSERIRGNNPLGTSSKEAAVLQLQVISRSFSVVHNCIIIQYSV